MRRHLIRRCPVGAAALLAVLLTAGAALGGEFERTFTFTGDDLEIVSMIGATTVVAAAGDAYEVTVRVRGKDAAEDLITFAAEEGRDSSLLVRFPVDEHTRYVYPALGSSKSTIHFRDDDPQETSWLRKVFAGLGGERITVSGSGRGLEVWADVTVAVPAGAGLKVRQGVGEVQARGVRGDLDLDTHAGGITVEDLEGDLRADTGSGQVTAAGVRGDLSIDTGSGSVELAAVKGAKVHVDTGSGRVRAETIDCTDLLIDTGSGSVRARGVSADRAKIDTGSGGVELQLDRMGTGRFVIDTGSGSIELELPEDASASISADTGSGSVRADVAGAEIQHKERNEMRLVVGDGAARVTLDAGSGSITVKGR
ncbi:MAG: DUF4097 family beta strand repeat protein [Krumholzibacteria bacterium]|nr:DUF4097 family beta strand repeat protein [Candidatus Krumholzibacteria bacterium]